ncbi:FAD_binding_3 domain-containing protein [Cephalotus follicularis]|uniref:FAD_binding_3 domain-containing protein n=1 Tax=Cephalotus follicularis TaxID=3775 RepID=A0A1Q3B6N4_CEPFO|nr:FAD_binding_3 domain-containing protein [Cephalotus follicularis]
MEIVEDVVIVGAGIAGLATAVALMRVGIRALVLERSDGLRATGAALTLFPNAWLALDALGVSHKLTSIYAPLKKGSVTNVRTGLIQDISLSETEGLYAAPRSVHRKVLLETLANELPKGTIRFSSKLATIESQAQEAGSPIAIIHLEDETVIKAKVLIGCDGVHSVVARWLGIAPPVHSGRSAVRGLAVFPQGHGHRLQEVQQFVDLGKRAGIVPLNDKEAYWFLSCLSPPKVLGDKMAENPELIQKEVIENYAKDFPSSFLDMVKHSDLSTLSWAPLMLRYPWNIVLGNLSKGNITLAGDAMHPMTPDLGQGGGSALEDAVVLGRHIGLSFVQNGRIVPKEMPQALQGYLKERKWRVAGLITGSYLSGWVQEGSNWLTNFLRYFFYRFFFARIRSVVSYDCGKLPSVSSSESNNSSKND